MLGPFFFDFLVWESSHLFPVNKDEGTVVAAISTMALRLPLVVLLESNLLHAMPRQSCRPSSVDGHRLFKVICTPFPCGDLVFRGYSRKFKIQLKNLTMALLRTP